MGCKERWSPEDSGCSCEQVSSIKDLPLFWKYQDVVGETEGVPINMAKWKPSCPALRTGTQWMGVPDFDSTLKSGTAVHTHDYVSSKVPDESVYYTELAQAPSCLAMPLLSAKAL